MVSSGFPLLDFSAEACSPEHAQAIAQGRLEVTGLRSRDFSLQLLEPLDADKKGDIWALGIALLHLSIGR
jgi:hypothetical protein